MPYLQARYGDGAPDRIGRKPPSIAPYGAFTCADAREFVLSIQNEREWSRFCECVLGDPAIATDLRFLNNSVRTLNREALDATVQAVFARLSYCEAVDRLTEAGTAYGAINSVHDLIAHSQLRTRPMDVGGRIAHVPATPYRTDWDDAAYPPAPRIDGHGASIREQFPVATSVRMTGSTGEVRSGRYSIGASRAARPAGGSVMNSMVEPLRHGGGRSAAAPIEA